ncbi:tetratricopeptide repeat protein [Microcoleus sp. FACHB-1515]|uniref:glycosyltransferase family 4 protein n=1 Tax=Cyanophyceae TaxID=3028117 RepID=UPI001682CB42|nr:glycosyltransferase family 4 protein [Microcoleus sp. FACHB-1515]MBD2092217.1 tetratricopeptide repeat protein [Microcoleus sp. FACHB-1515]
MRFRLDFTAIAQMTASTLEAMNLFEQAQQFYRQSLVALLVAVCRWFVTLSPRSPHAHYKLAKALLQQEQWEAAAAACERAIALDPTTPSYYQALTAAYCGQGLLAKAVQASKQAIVLQPTNAWCHYDLAKAYISQEEWLSAIQACQRAIELDPDISWFYFNLGEALVKAGRWAEAAQTLQHAITLQPNFAWSYYYLGEALLAQDQTAAAIAAYAQAVRLRPNNHLLQGSLEYARRLRLQGQRIADYQQQLATTPNGEKLKILMLTPYPPFPPTLGALSRMFHEIKSLGDRHHVTVASFIFTKEDYVLEAELEQYCDLTIMLHLGDAEPKQPKQPKLIHRYSSQRMEKVLRELSAIEFDIVSFNFIYMAQYRHLFPRAYHVLEEHNIESELLKRCAEVNPDSTAIDKLAKQVDAVRAFVESEQEAQLLAAYEDAQWPQFPLRHVVSETDKAILDSRCKVGETLVVNNGIDTRSIVPFPDNSSKRILFIGTMSYYPNIDGACYFAESILPLIWQQDPTVQFWIAGASPPQSVKDLGRDDRIQVIADPDDMSEVAKACCLTVVPLRVGSGTRIKIIHSMAMGLPVVSTSLGCEGLKVQDGEHLLVCDRPADFAAGVLKLLQDASLRQKFRTNSRQLVEQEYDWQSIYAQSEQQMVERFQQWKCNQMAGIK